MKPAELLENLVATPSVSGEEKALADWFGDWLAEQGFCVQRSGNNLWFSVGSGGPRLLLNSHLDTVPACDGWTREPWVPAREGDRLYGLGANDAKGCVAAMTAAALALARHPEAPGGEVMFAFTAEEETGGAGIATILDRLGPLDAAVVGEPTGLAACTAQRGMLLLKCTAHGTPGHVAHGIGEGNAIHAAAADIARLAALRWPPHPVLGEMRAQVTQVAGGRRRNQVPDTCEFFVDLRTTPDVAHEELADWLDTELVSEVAVHSQRYRPRATDSDAPIVRAALAAGATGPVGSATASDWAFLGALPAVKLGPGDTRRSHTADEYLTLGELEAGATLYTALITHYFQEAARERAA